MMNSKINESQDSRFRASQDQSHHSGIMHSDKSKNYRDFDRGADGGDVDDYRGYLEEAKQYIVEGAFSQAIDRCKLAQSKAHKNDKDHSPEMLQIFLVNAEAHIGEGKLKKAEDFLISAYWTLLKHNKDEGQQEGQQQQQQQTQAMEKSEYDHHKGTLHKVFSKLFLAKGAFERALDDLKTAIYIDSCQYGPEHVQTSISYFNFGDILLHLQQEVAGYKFYYQGVRIWYKQFKNYFRESMSHLQSDLDNNLILAQGRVMLKNTEGLFHERLKNCQGEVEEREITRELFYLYYTLAFLHKFLREDEIRDEYLQQTETIMRSLWDVNHPKAQRFYEFFELQPGDFQQNQTGYEQGGGFDAIDGNSYQQGEENSQYQHGDEEEHYEPQGSDGQEGQHHYEGEPGEQHEGMEGGFEGQQEYDGEHQIEQFRAEEGGDQNDQEQLQGFSQEGEGEGGDFGQQESLEQSAPERSDDDGGVEGKGEAIPDDEGEGQQEEQQDQ